METKQAIIDLLNKKRLPWPGGMEASGTKVSF